ncbi:MAG: glycosyltransferase family 4 protein [Actinomycetota bacterium]
MRILVVCPHFDPDAAPTGVVITEIVHRLADDGHEIEVVTSLPWYVSHAIEPGWGGRPVRTERTAWGRITRVHPFPTDKRSIPARALGFAGFTALATWVSVVRRRRPDVVLAMSPPLTLGLTGWIAARLRRVPFVFNIQDVFPDVAIEVGAITNPRLIRLLRWLERFTYRRADAVTVLSDDLRDNVEEKLAGRGGTAVRVIPNFVDTDRITPQHGDNAYRREFGLGDRTVVMYAGNLGFSQPIELMIDTARELRHRADVVFVVNGGGSTRPGLEEAAADLDNVVFVDFQPPERLPEVLAAGDIHVIALRTGLGRSSVPSKMYSILAAGRPVFASVDAGTEVVRVVERTGAGLAVAPDDAEAFRDGLLELLAVDRSEMGERGRAFVEEWVSPAGVAAAYGELFDELRS